MKSQPIMVPQAGPWAAARRAPATVAEVMRPPATTVDQNDHVAAAAYLMKPAGATALVVLAGQDSNRPIGIITEADIVHTVANGKEVNDVRIHYLMTARPTVIGAVTSIRDAGKPMTNGRFRHLPGVDDDASHRDGRYRRCLPRSSTHHPRYGP